MSGLEPVKAAGAWAWKLLENPFIDFLKRRWEDAKSDSEKAQYLQTRWNEFRAIASQSFLRHCEPILWRSNPPHTSREIASG